MLLICPSINPACPSLPEPFPRGRSTWLNGCEAGSPVVTLVPNGIAAGAVVTESGDSTGGLCGVIGHFPWLRQSLAAQTWCSSLRTSARGSAPCCSFPGLLGKGQQGMLVALWEQGHCLDTGHCGRPGWHHILCRLILESTWVFN